MSPSTAGRSWPPSPTCATWATTQSPSSTGLAFTGTSAAVLGLVALGMVLAGVVIVRFQRGRAGATG